MADWRPMLNRRDDGFPRIMGVVNITPDSFHPDSRSANKNQALATASSMAADGAEWIDVGGEPTRPGAKPVSVRDELDTVVHCVA